MFKDNKDFYPTPETLFYKLLNGKRNFSGRILEPSAGVGTMIEYIKKMSHYNSDLQIDAIEKDERLAAQLQAKNVSVVWDDFLTYETYKAYDTIIMNPPFSAGVDHALKAIELAESQLSHCELFMIINRQTLMNDYANKRKKLNRLLHKYDADVNFVKEGFSDGERKTDVEVALIRMNIVDKNKGKNIYDDILFDTTTRQKEELETALSTYVKDSEISSRLNDIERLVLEYEKACEVTKEAFEANKDKESFYSYINEVNSDDGNEYRGKLNSLRLNDARVEDYNEDLDRLRRGYWSLILDTDDFKDMLTNDAIQKLNRQLDTANEMEINLTNIKMLMMALGANQSNILTDSIVSIFEKITKYHMNDYSSNIHYYDGWKTNNAYRINHKIIIPIRDSYSWNWFDEDYRKISIEVRNFIQDIVKGFKLIDENVSDDFETITKQEFENDLLRFKMFLNGNVHIWFKDMKLLNKLNYICGSHFNWIPAEEEIKNNEKAREYVIKEFGKDVLDVELLKE